MRDTNRARLLLMAAMAALGASSFVPHPSAAQEKPKIYSLLPNTALSGVVDPAMPDRKNINKAWPKIPKDQNQIQIGWTEITLGNPWFVDLIRTAKRAAT
jgi:ribose transport system substrate-binding protein